MQRDYNNNTFEGAAQGERENQTNQKATIPFSLLHNSVLCPSFLTSTRDLATGGLPRFGYRGDAGEI